MREFHSRKEPYRIYHGSTSTTRKMKLSRNNIIDTSQMGNVLSIDNEKKLAIVEPNVSMEKLVDACLPKGVLPPVVMEFPEITVGGGFAGTAGESSSFRHGLFDRTISKLEMVLADGEVVTASRTERADLFHGVAGSFGTFGVITLLEIPLIEAQPYVTLAYTPVDGMETAVEKTEELTADHSVDYLEGIMFGLKKGLIISGKLTSKADVDPKIELRHYTRAQDTWFYLNAQAILNQEFASGARELVPTKDYLFRYDRGTFWAGYYAFKYFITPFNAFTRYLLDYFMHTSVMYAALHKSHIADEFIVQDIGFPYATVGNFVEYLDKKFGIYPLWLCPLLIGDENMSLRPKRMRAFEPDARSKGMMMNVGVWGPGPKRYDDFIEANREVERKTAELGGLKCFYAQAFYTEDEFWGLYDKAWYDSLRAKYKASELPTAYEKINQTILNWKPESEQSWGEWGYTKLKQTWPVRGVYGVLNVLVRKEFLITK